MGVQTERPCTEVRNQEGAAEHGDIFHEENHLDLRHHGIGYCPELMQHQGDRNQEQHDEPGAKFCAVAQQNTEAIGDSETVAKKILYVNDVLGGISRVTFQLGVSTLPHEKMLHAIEILGTRVAPIVRSELSVTPVRA
jgi:hypothetical protein